MLAHNLHLSHGVDIHLCKLSDRLGGDVRSATVCNEDGIFLYKEGPISFEASPSMMRISRELNLEDDMVFAPSLSPWIHRAGKLHPLPGGKFFGPGGVLNFVLFDDLLSWRGKSRAFMGAFLGHAPPPPPPAAAATDSTVLKSTNPSSPPVSTASNDLSSASPTVNELSSASLTGWAKGGGGVKSLRGAGRDGKRVPVGF